MFAKLKFYSLVNTRVNALRDIWSLHRVTTTVPFFSKKKRKDMLHERISKIRERKAWNKKNDESNDTGERQREFSRWWHREAPVLCAVRGMCPAVSKTISLDYNGRPEESIGRSPRNKLNSQFTWGVWLHWGIFSSNGAFENELLIGV